MQGQWRRVWGFPWHCGTNTIPALSTWQTAHGGRWNNVVLHLCGGFVASLNGEALSIYLQTLGCNKCAMTLFIPHKAGSPSMPTLLGIISCTTNCLSSYQPPVIWELRVEGWPNLKGDGKCCLKWIRKAAGFISAPSLTCAAKRKQVTVECVLKPKRNTSAQMICCHSGRSAFLEISLMSFTDQFDLLHHPTASGC